MHQKFKNEVETDKKDINYKIVLYHFLYQSQSFLDKDFFEANQDKNEQLVNNINDWLINLRNTAVKKRNFKNTKSEENNQCYWKNPWL